MKSRRMRSLIKALILAIFIIGLAVSSCSNKRNPSEETALPKVEKSHGFKYDSSFTLNDTLFIFRDSVEGTAQSIFFDNNRNSHFYNDINGWSFQANDLESYTASINYLKEKNLKLNKKKPIIPYTKWITLKRYKGVFYAYHVCDYYHHYQASINDSTYIDWTGEGRDANQIVGQKKIDDQTYEYQLNGVVYHERKIHIHLIDKERGIALFEEVDPEFNENNFYYMIASEKIRSVPIIVNNCETSKQFELGFDNISQQEVNKIKEMK